MSDEAMEQDEAYAVASDRSTPYKGGVWLCSEDAVRLADVLDKAHPDNPRHRQRLTEDDGVFMSALLQLIG